MTIDEKISEAVRASLTRLIDKEIKQSIFESVTSIVAEPQERLTLKRLAVGMARAVFDAEVHITEFEPTPDKDGKVPDAYVIDNTMLPDWDISQRIRGMRGEPPRPTKTIVFPSVEKALEAIAVAYGTR